MENKKYLDKVIGSLVRGTRIDYINNSISHPRLPHLSSPLPLPFFSFFSYCKNTFGLTDEEIKYVWKEYREIIKDKIEDGE